MMARSQHKKYREVPAPREEKRHHASVWLNWRGNTAQDADSYNCGGEIFSSELVTEMYYGNLRT